MITVEEAEKIIQAEIRNYGAEIIPFDLALGRVLAEDIKADRDLPPFDRVTMDGIAVRYESIQNGVNTFKIKATQAAGDASIAIDEPNQCVEIMTGAALSQSLDTVIRYEDLEIRAGLATIIIDPHQVRKGQSIHRQGSDKKQNEVVAASGELITPAIISLLASVGEAEVRVKKLPRVVIISSGDELVEVEQTPSIYQIRRSNNYTVKSVLQQHGIDADMLHIPDDPEITVKKLAMCLQSYDVLLLSGGISMGKFDYIPEALKILQVHQLFYKVKQRPGKPFWFGRHENGAVVFAFPGNPVATFMCIYRFFIPWLHATLGLQPQARSYAVLDSDFTFTPALKYFLQVKLHSDNQGRQIATPIEGNGSGDFANLADTNAFMELPLEQNDFKKEQVYPVWTF